MDSPTKVRITALLGSGSTLEVEGPTTTALSEAVRKKNQFIDEIGKRLDALLLPTQCNFEDLFDVLETLQSWRTGSAPGTAPPYRPREIPFLDHLDPRWLDPLKILDAIRDLIDTVAEEVEGTGITEKVVWCVVRECAANPGKLKLAPHDLRRTCARLCHVAGGELEQIQFLLGHASVQTTEQYLGCKQRLKNAVNDCIGIESEGG